MKIFDWILLSIGIPWLLLVIFAIGYASFKLPDMAWGITGKTFYPLIPLLWFAYRRWG